MYAALGIVLFNRLLINIYILYELGILRDLSMQGLKRLHSAN
jgi:hypothetical protein